MGKLAGVLYTIPSIRSGVARGFRRGRWRFQLFVARSEIGKRDKANGGKRMEIFGARMPAASMTRSLDFPPQARSPRSPSRRPHRGREPTQSDSAAVD